MDWKRKNTTHAPVEKLHEIAPGVSIPLLHFPILERTHLVTEAFTTRAGGASGGIFSTLNLSFARGDDEAAVRENYRRVAAALGTTPDRFVASDQTHTTNVKIVTKGDAGCGVVREKYYHDVDGLVTDVPGIVLAAFFADCVPLYFVDPFHKVIGLSHSGWRGTAARMGYAMLDMMNMVYGTDPADVVCAIGPSICKDCYEVDSEVAGKFAAEFRGHKTEILTRKENGKYKLDLWRANERVLLDAGVLPEHIEVTDICTCCNPERLFSHRASRGKRGNLAAFLSLRNTSTS